MRSFRGLSGIQFALFIVIAAVVALLIAKVLGFIVSVLFAVLGYLVAFAIAVWLLLFIWQKISGGGHGHGVDMPYDDRTPDGRQRY